VIKLADAVAGATTRWLAMPKYADSEGCFDVDPSFPLIVGHFSCQLVKQMVLKRSHCIVSQEL
jgi:hypothetical protein